MSSSPPPEPPHFRGKTLTPESPRPLHVAEPSNIPVLENQIDPVFNQMSTHIGPLRTTHDTTAVAQFAAEMDTSDDVPSGRAEVDMVESSGDAAGESADNDGDGTSASFTNKATQPEQDQQNSSLDQIQASSLTDRHASVEPPTSSSLSFDQVSHNFKEPLIPSQLSPIANGSASTTTLSNSSSAKEEAMEQAPQTVPTETVNIQELLDRIVSPEGPIASDGQAALANAQVAEFNAAPISMNNPNTLGLPPRPPPQAQLSINPNYPPAGDIRTYHFPQINQTDPPLSLSASNPYGLAQPYPANIQTSTVPPAALGSNGLPPPPLATFQQLSHVSQAPEQRSPTQQQLRQNHIGARTKSNTGARDDETPWGPEIQRKYDEFLDEEAVYTAEGTWDKFPQGSRLFVGNLPTEIVTKRDIFHIFHRFGRLAQISIKQAYGFVQFMDTNACTTALQVEQGGRIKDRQMHLEISKPPKSGGRNAGQNAGNNRGSHFRRSRSPDHDKRPNSRGIGGRGGGGGNERFGRNLPFSDFRDEPQRRRDDYRPNRSPSPRGYRKRDRSPDRFHGGRRDRSRSPYNRSHYRSPSPRRRSLEDSDSLPMMRRDARDVPDVQFILVDELDRNFVTYIEKSFRDRGLRVAVLMMPNVSYQAVVKRQILEGVQAIVKLNRAAQTTGKISLQVFDRSGGVNNVRFEEYEALDAHIAAELVIRAKQTQATAIQTQAHYPVANQAPQQLGLQVPPQQTAATGGQPNLANLISSLDGPSLQRVLGALQNSPQTPTAFSPTQNPELAALLGGVARQPPPPQAPPAQAPPQGYVYGQPQFPFNTYPQSQQGAPQYQQQQAAAPPQPQHVQNIMQQLARWKQ